MGVFSKIIGLLGITYDVAENARETKVDVKDNKSEERHYDFDDGTGYSSEDFLRERKKRKDEKRKGKITSKPSSKSKDSGEHEL